MRTRSVVRRIALLADDQAAAGTAIRQAVAPGKVYTFSTFPDLVAFVRSTIVTGVVLQPSGVADYALFLRWVRSLRSQLPSVPLLLHWGPSHCALCPVADLIRAGVDEVVIRGVEDTPERFLHRLTMASTHRASAPLLDRLLPLVGEQARAVVEACLRVACRPASVASLAKQLGVSRRTLSARCQSWGLLTPASMIIWIRLMVAAHLLADPGRSIENVAHAMGFGGGAGLHNLLKRHAGLRPSDLRQETGLMWLVRCFERRLAENCHARERNYLLCRADTTP